MGALEGPLFFWGGASGLGFGGRGACELPSQGEQDRGSRIAAVPDDMSTNNGASHRSYNGPKIRCL